jgi:hypothetical protein
MSGLPPLRHFVYVLGTVNVVIAIILVIGSFLFSSGVNVVSVIFIVLVVNLISALTVVRQA